MARTRTASSAHDDGDDHDSEHAGEHAGDVTTSATVGAPGAGATVAAASVSPIVQHAQTTTTTITLAEAQDELRRGLAATHDAAVAAAVAAGNDALVQAYMNLAQPSHVAAPSPSAAAVAVAAQPPVAAAGIVAPPPMVAITQLPTRCPPFRESYNDMGELRRELKVLSVRMSLPYYMQHSSPQRLEARCPTWKHRKTTPTSCEFVVSANRHTNGRVYVTRAVVAHAPNCSVAQSKPGSYITAAALMETAKPFMSQAGSAVRPKDMAGIMKDQFGVSTSYMTAWRALSAFKQEQKLEEGASFMKIRGYLDAFVQSNVGSVAAFEYLPDSTTFARAFLCPKPLQLALRYCRAQVLLSVFLITSAHGGVLMTATAQDAMGENVPLALALAPAESDENWRFFLKHLEASVQDFGRSPLTFVHSRSEELQRPLHEFFPTCHQSDAVEQFAHAPTSRVAGGNGSSSGGTAAQGEHAFQWLESLCTKTPLMVLVGWVSKVASTLYQRHGKYGSVTSEYPEEYHSLLTQYEAQGSHHEVLRIAENGYEVIDHQTGRQRVVDFAKQSCTCGEFDASRFPCLHVFLSISAAGLERAAVIPRIFLMDSLKALYGGRITPIDVETITPDNMTMPIPQPKTRGRPRKVQQIQQFGDAKQEKLACSVCGVKGHNKRTCKRVVVAGTAGSNSISNTVIGGHSSDSGAASTSHDSVSASGLHATSGAADDEDEESTFLDTTYVDEEDLPFDHSSLHHSADHHQLPIVDASAAAALATKQPGAASSGDAGSASPSAKKRKLPPTSAAADAAAVARDASAVEPAAMKKLATEPESSAAPETTTL